ncbi:MAG: hypothetical protein JWO36_2160 [Myxococcales bacterium]|nr:hypothetical protein [Myxococcales bacterium]
MRTSLLHSLVLVGLAGGCTGSGQVTYSGQVQTPELVEVSPGVQVIADYDEPIFYSDNYYWRNDGGVWFRSRTHTGGWARFEAAPVAIRSIDRPSAYVHFHAGAHANMNENREQVRDHRDAMPPPPPPPEVRDHREAMPPPPPPPPPVVRDHRDEHEEHKAIKEERKEMKEERKDAKEERKDAKEQRKDAKEQRKEDKHERHGH